MTNLSLAAAAVLDATYREMDYAPRRHVQWAAAAALRAVADQVVPQPPKNWDLISTVAARECEIRKNLLAIADELEGIKYGTYRCNIADKNNDR